MNKPIIVSGKWYKCIKNTFKNNGKSDKLNYIENKVYECKYDNVLDNESGIPEYWDNSREPEKYFTQWSFPKDAKRGDVLAVANNHYFILKNIISVNIDESGCNYESYGYYVNGVYYPKTSCESCFLSVDEVRPAREDEKKKLFDAMAEKGYEWDSNKWCVTKIKNDVPPGQTTSNRKFFNFIYDRLLYVHGENADVDYMRSFKERIDYLFPEKDA